LKIIYEPIYDNKKGMWGRKFNKKLQEEKGMVSVINFIQRHKNNLIVMTRDVEKRG